MVVGLSPLRVGSWTRAVEPFLRNLSARLNARIRGNARAWRIPGREPKEACAPSMVVAGPYRRDRRPDQSLARGRVDDEPAGRGRRSNCSSHAKVNFAIVTAACCNRRGGHRRRNAQQPDVLFLDVQMPEVDGFDVIRQL